MPTPKQRPQKPLDVFAGQVAEVIAVSKRRAFILDLAGQLRYAEDGAERPSPITITMPGMPLIVADPQVHRRLDALAQFIEPGGELVIGTPGGIRLELAERLQEPLGLRQERVVDGRR